MTKEKESLTSRIWQIGIPLIQTGLLVASLIPTIKWKQVQESLKRNMRISESDNSSLSEEEIRRIEEFAKRRNDVGKYRVYEELPKLIAPYISGNEELKQAICFSLASTPDYPLHLLMIGEPGTVKTDLLNEVMAICPEAIMGGPRSTESGLTYDARTGKPGLFIKANGGLALIDELDKINRRELNTIYQALENGKISMHTSKMHGEYETKMCCIAAANPKGHIFDKDLTGLQEQITSTIEPGLLSRFHLVYILADRTSKELENAVSKILTRRGKTNENIVFLRNYFKYIRKKLPEIRYDFDEDSPTIRKATESIVQVIEKSKMGKLPYWKTKRLAVAVKRLAITSARLRLSESVEEPDIDLAIQIVNNTHSNGRIQT